jgi:hypothetical protein
MPKTSTNKLPEKPEVKKVNKVASKNGKGIKLELEYTFHCSPSMLYHFLSHPDGLQDWFADEVTVSKDVFTFVWDGSEQKAKLVGKKENSYVKFSWLDDPENNFEFKLVVDELTSDLALFVIDYAEDQVSAANSKLLWNSQVETLLHAIGA